MRALRTAGAATALAFAAIGALAQSPPARIIAACEECHGPGGNARDPAVPSLAGQPAIFIENQLVLVREGLRDVPVMKAAVAGLTDPEIIALARHFAAQVPVPARVAPQAEKVRAGAELSQRLLCATCHRPGYVGQQQVPRLAGQNETYLMNALRQFRDQPGPGRDTIMASTLRGLTDTDLAALAHYLAQTRP
jgi:cytochrome c553